MKRCEDPRQSRLFDVVTDYLSDRQQQMAENSYAGVFRRLILKLMPVDKLGSGLSPDQNRPSVELYAISCLILLKDWFGWTDTEAVDQYNFNLKLQYALNVDGSYLCAPSRLARARRIPDVPAAPGCPPSSHTHGIF
jgi:hypothetical protein